MVAADQVALVVETRRNKAHFVSNVSCADVALCRTAEDVERVTVSRDHVEHGQGLGWKVHHRDTVETHIAIQIRTRRIGQLPIERWLNTLNAYSARHQYMPKSQDLRPGEAQRKTYTKGQTCFQCLASVATRGVVGSKYGKSWKCCQQAHT